MPMTRAVQDADSARQEPAVHWGCPDPGLQCRGLAMIGGVVNIHGAKRPSLRRRRVRGRAGGARHRDSWDETLSETVFGEDVTEVE